MASGQQKNSATSFKKKSPHVAYTRVCMQSTRVTCAATKGSMRPSKSTFIHKIVIRVDYMNGVE